ncbi:MAG: S16 family serine protease, partial [Bdellovibrionota bacterium]|nr:S16 family serine protease [Bdellovibrionota bacterium]
IAKGETGKTIMDAKTVCELLGPQIYTDEDRKINDEVGVATGLAWTAVGGQILYIEATKMKGKGLTLTGQLGEVMKESAQTAIGFIRSQYQNFCIDEDAFEKNEIHIHLPAGAIPKDGPSAGITLATAIVSLLTGCPIHRKIAMTGEITLTGKVLPVGGIKEKALAAMRMDIPTVIFPYKNKKDLVDIPQEYRDKIEFVPVKTFEEVLGLVLEGWDKKKKEFQDKFMRENSDLEIESGKKVKEIPPAAA